MDVPCAGQYHRIFEIADAGWVVKLVASRRAPGSRLSLDQVRGWVTLVLVHSLPHPPLPAIGLPKFVVAPVAPFLWPSASTSPSTPLAPALAAAIAAAACPLTPTLTAPVPCLSGAPPPLGGWPVSNCLQLSGLILNHLILGPLFACSDTRNP